MVKFKVTYHTDCNCVGASGDADPTAPLRNIMQMLPPMLSTINDQTGIQPPSWIAQMPKGQEESQVVKEDHHAAANGKMVNGRH